jgi:ribosomal protein S18 acetylase RimI-like enzyme
VQLQQGADRDEVRLPAEGPAAALSDLDLLRRLEPNAAAMAASGWAEHVAVGAFDAWFVDQPGGNYAAPRLPLPDGDAIARALEELAALFAARGRPLVIELTEPLFPDLPRLIEAAGIPLANREPILICPAADLRPRRARDVTVRFLQPDDHDEELAAFLAVWGGVFEREASIEALRAELRGFGGRTAALAELNGRPATTGFLARYENGVAELTRVATAPWARRRGVAATLTTFMVEDAIATGHDLTWLTASGPPAQALYQTLGFHVVGDRLYYEAATV